ncbi:lipase family protein [Nocardioides ultimimeridianus]
MRKPELPAHLQRRSYAVLAAAGLLGSIVTLSGAGVAADRAQAAAPATVSASTTTLDDAFYTPPSPLPAGNPGDVIRSRVAPAGPSTTQAIANAWQVMYRSTDASGAAIATTGTVLVPKGVDAAHAPIVGFAPGTQGLSFNCAPSKMIAGGSFYEQPAVNAMLRAGYAVAVPDYEGYHADPSATYMTGPAMGPAVLDMVRAAQSLPADGLSASSPVTLRGYSQGGAAVLWAGQLQPTYAPSLPLKGIAAGGVPGNLSQVALPLNGSSGFGLLAIALIGLDNAYPELNLQSYLNDAGKQAFAQMENGDCALDLLQKYQGKTLADYTTTNPLSNITWLTRVSQSTLGNTAVPVPVLEYHGTTDGLVDFAQDDALHKTYCAKGVQVTWKTYDTSSLGKTPASHISPISWANDDVMAFLADRFAGKPATTNC